MAWPQDDWYALSADARIRVEVEGSDTPRWWPLRVVDGDVLHVPSGRLGVADPDLVTQGPPLGEVQVPPGSYPVQITEADVSGRDDASHVRTAYLSVLLSAAAEVRRRKLALLPRGDAPPPLADDEFIGFGVDSGMACLVDVRAAQRYYPNVDAWFVRHYPESRAWLGDPPDEDEDADWFDALYGPLGSHLRPGQPPRAVVSLPLPRAPGGENVVAVNSGWGDCYYAVVAGYDASNRLAAVHVDFFLPHPWIAA